MAANDKEISTVMKFATAGLGGVLAWVVVHPFNTVAVQMSLATMSGKKPEGLIRFGSSLIKQQGVRSLYNGIGAGVGRQTIYATSRFGLFETFRDEYQNRMGSIDLPGRALCGLSSGAIAAFISCPMEVCLVRLSNDSSLPPEKRRNYTGVFNAFSRIMKEEGPKTFFSGSGPYVNRAILVGLVQVASYDQFKESYDSMGVKHPILNNFCAAMSSGFLYALVTMPLESCKNRMAFQKPDPVTKKMPYSGTIQALTKIASEEGVLRLWNGFPPYYLRCGGHSVGMFMSIQWLRSFL